jgi:hypothetical protein
VNCAQCHQAAGQGGALTQGKYAPNLMEATPKEIRGDDHRGRGAMPVFADSTLPVHDKQAIIAYISALQEASSPGGLSLGRLGPVTRGGYLVWTAAAAALVGAAVSDRNQGTMSDLATPSEHGSAPARLGRSPSRTSRIGRGSPTPTPRPRAAPSGQVAFMFVLAMLLFIAFVASFVLIDPQAVVYIRSSGRVRAMNVALGACMGTGTFLIGAGAMPSGPGN